VAQVNATSVRLSLGNSELASQLEISRNLGCKMEMLGWENEAENYDFPKAHFKILERKY